MSATLVLRFVLGRYHATPWGRHVNEGQVELPPSPWRLLRALYAVWKTRTPDLDAPVVHGLLERLAVPPEYYVPPHRISHTRHYYPDSKSRTGTPSVDRTLDAFAVFDRRGTLAVRWRGVDLATEQEKALRRLAEALPYLGRADSLCEARVDPGWEPEDHHQLWSPLDVGESIPDSAQTTTLLAPALPLDVDALVARPVDVRAKNLLFPPSTRFLGYFAAQEAWTPKPVTPARHRRVEVVRFTVTSRVRPRYLDAVGFCDLLRLAALSRLGTFRPEPACSMLAGRDENGVRLGGHQHAHFLALPDVRRRLGELVVWAPGGLADDELGALAGIPEVGPPGTMPGFGRVSVRISGYGTSGEALGDLAGPARRWRSVSPYVPARHPKRDWATFLEEDVRRELSYRDIPTRARVQLVDGDFRPFVRYRPTQRFATSAADRRGARRGQFLSLTFAEPVIGPLALGHLSHFGLGLFRPVLD